MDNNRRKGCFRRDDEDSFSEGVVFQTKLRTIFKKINKTDKTLAKLSRKK